MALGKVFRKLAVYVGIAIVVLVLFTVITITTKGAKVPSRWLALAIYTVGLFWAIIRQSREYWRRPNFWLAIAGLLALHVLAFVAILQTYPEWRGIWFVPVVIVEGGLFGVILSWFLGRTKSGVA